LESPEATRREEEAPSLERVPASSVLAGTGLPSTVQPGKRKPRQEKEPARSTVTSCLTFFTPYLHYDKTPGSLESEPAVFHEFVFLLRQREQA